MTDQLLELPYAPLDIDPARYDPTIAARRLIGISNALMDLYRCQGENQSRITIMGTRKGDDYRQVRADQYRVESQIRALELKNSVLNSINYMKNNEMKYLSK